MKRASDEENRQPAKTPRTLSKQKSSSNSSLDHPRDPVHVFCRLKPLRNNAEVSSVKLLSSTTLTLTGESKIQRKECNYVFGHIFSSHSGQREVFEHVALPLLENAINGKNGLLFTYGVTGSGKTFTLTGNQDNPGIMPRCINTLFNTIGEYQALKYLIKSDKMNGFEIQSEEDARKERFLEARSTAKKHRTIRKGNGDSSIVYANDGIKISQFSQSNRFAVFISYIEIYNNTVYDLLDESTSGKVLQAKILREDIQKNMYVNNVIELEVKTAAEAFELFHIGQKRKRMADTVLNSESSRSHSSFTIRVVQLQQDQNIIPENNFLLVGQLSFVDLAGSERCNRTKNTGIRLKEASSINNSLMSLRACLELLRENQLTGSNKLIPYRDSRLTLLFKNYFEGKGQVQMIVCINPAVEDYEENLQVLKFAEMTQEVKVQRSEARYTPYKKTPKPNKDIKRLQTPATLKPKKIFSSTLGPKFPSSPLHFNLDDPETNDKIIETYIKIINGRKNAWERNKRQYMNKEEHFRNNLVKSNKGLVLSISEVQNLKALLKKQDYTNNNLESKVNNLEIVNDTLVAKNSELQEMIKTLHGTIEEKTLKLNQHNLKHEQDKQKFAQQSVKMSRELDEKLRKQREHLQAVMDNKDAKLQEVRDILNKELPSTPSKVETFNDYTPQQTPLPHRRNVTKSNKRRSRSAGDVYLEHNAVKPVSLGTVFQPLMKKRKSVTKLDKAKDVINNKQNKYCLIAQQKDAEGEIETKLYKADILPTCGGGAQVIFNDVEKLTQESPTGSPNYK